MELKPSKEVFGLDSRKFENNKTLFEIIGHNGSKEPIEAKEYENKNKEKYTQYDLAVLGQNNNAYMGEFVVRFLFGRQLNPLIKAFGETTEKWIGKHIWVVSEKDASGFLKWKLEAAE